MGTWWAKAIPFLFPEQLDSSGYVQEWQRYRPIPEGTLNPTLRALGALLSTLAQSTDSKENLDIVGIHSAHALQSEVQESTCCYIENCVNGDRFLA